MASLNSPLVSTAAVKEFEDQEDYCDMEFDHQNRIFSYILANIYDCLSLVNSIQFFKI